MLKVIHSVVTMASIITAQELRDLTVKVMKSKGIHEYDLRINGGTEKGENYLGEVIFFDIIPKNSEKVFHMVMKTAKRSEKLRTMMPVGIAYHREVYMYCTVFPDFEKFVKESNADIRVNYTPKMFTACNEEYRETIILENLKYEDYQLSDRTKPMELNHVLLVMEYLGKHHAISLAMKKKAPEKFENLSQNLTNIWPHFSNTLNTETFFGASFKTVLCLLKEHDRNDLATKFETYATKLETLVYGETPEEDRLVICHGDCWTNNIMFKYKDGDVTRPTKLCFLDFQLSMIDTPVKDLSYFIYTSCDKSNLDHFDLILKTYHAALVKTLGDFGCSHEKIFTYHDLMKHWKKYSWYGLILSLLITKIQMFNSDEAPDFLDVVESGESLSASLDFRMKNEGAFNKRILEVFTHFGDTNLK